ncbi:hypothetical protein BJV78DRAFT_1254353, partial [Lactifluus subvellereus]
KGGSLEKWRRGENNDVGRWVTREAGGEMDQIEHSGGVERRRRDKESELGRMGRMVMACKGSGEAVTLK